MQLQALFALGAGVVVLVLGLVQGRRARAFADTPVSLARSAAQGYAVFSGIARALPGDVLRAPLTGRRCLWYDYKVEQRSGSRNERWRTIDSGTSEATFALEDATGQVVIDPAGAALAGFRRTTWYAASIGDPPSMAAFAWLGGAGSRYRCSECVVAEGEPLSAAGEYRTRRPADHAGTVDEEAALRLRLWKRDPRRMHDIDRNRDGTISMNEWELARLDAREEVARELHEQAALPGVSLLQRPTDGRLFLIGAGTAAAQVSRHRWRSLACIVAGFTLLVAGVLGLQA